MNLRDPNVQQLQLVAQALGHLREKLVFVGGCATGILITDERQRRNSTNSAPSFGNWGFKKIRPLMSSADGA
jgi:hypothetical protein